MLVAFLEQEPAAGVDQDDAGKTSPHPNAHRTRSRPSSYSASMSVAVRYASAIAVSTGFTPPLVTCTEVSAT